MPTQENIKETTIKILNSGPKKVKYSEINGLAIFEGDIELGTVEEINKYNADTGANPSESNASIIVGEGHRWPNGTIPYSIHSDLPNPSRVTDAIAEWESKTPIRFIQRTNESDYIEFIGADECSSSVGMQGGKQLIRLAQGCDKGSAIHEIGHAVGLWHEQSREDRDNYVRIIWDNIDPSERHNFEQHISDGDDFGPYNYESIMHYDKYAFSRNGQPTIETIQADVKIGQHDHLSEGDINAVYAMYTSSEQLKQVVDFAERFRAVNDYAFRKMRSTAFPNFHQADYQDGRGVVYGVVFIKPEAVEGRDVPVSELGNPDSNEARFRAVNDYAIKNGFGAAFPNFHQADHQDGRGVVYGVMLLKPEAVEWRDVPVSQLGNPDSNEARFRAVNDYAVENGFRAGFPNFHQADYQDGKGVVYGVMLLKPEAVEYSDVPMNRLVRREN